MENIKVFNQYITYCCSASVYGRGTNQGLFCSECRKEIGSYKEKEMNKKYKLIKEYPGSPELGQIVSPKTCVNEEDTNNYYWEGSWFNPKSFPEFWELIKEKDYETLSYKYNNKIYEFVGLYKSIGLDKDKMGRQYENNKGEGLIHEHTMNMLTVEPEIHSVRRLSDGEFFTIGDKLQGYDNEITQFIIDGNWETIGVTFGKYTTVDLKAVYKAKKKPILITEDKVELFEGDKAYHICTLEGSWNVKESLVRKEISNPPSYFKYFTDKEKAEEYVLENKPRYSLNNIEEAIKACLPLGLSYKGWKEGFTTDLKEYLKK